jgi:hypothetical protein
MAGKWHPGLDPATPSKKGTTLASRLLLVFERDGRSGRPRPHHRREPANRRTTATMRSTSSQVL